MLAPVRARVRQDLVARTRERFERIYREGRDAWTHVRLYPETVTGLLTAMELQPDLVRQPALDLGCGRGRMLAELEQHGFERRVGVDLSIPALRDARRRASRGALAGDALALPFRDGAFGLVAELTLLCSLEPDLWRGVADEAARVLAPGGFLLSEQVQRPPGHPLREPVETACKLPRTLDEVWGLRPDDFDALWGRTMERVFLAEVPVRDPATDTPSWVGLYRKR